MGVNFFSSEVELGKFLGSIDIIPDAYRAISETYTTRQFHTNPCAYNLHNDPSGLQVLAFHCTPDYTNRFLDREFDLVSSEKLEVIDFLSTQLNSSFSINQAAVDLFEHLFVELSEFENQLIDDPFVITGQGLAGYIAILFALHLQNFIDSKVSNDYWDSKRPICITFGSPLVGDEDLQQTISGRPQWKHCFLNVVAKTDLFASIFSSSSLYKPFGTFMFCTESGGHTVFEDQESVLAVLDAMASLTGENSEMHDYGTDLGLIRKKVLYRGASESGEIDLNVLKAGITLQFQEIGMLVTHKSDSLNDLINRMVIKKQKKRISDKRYAYQAAKYLSEIEINLTYFEWYIKTREQMTGGYYSCYRSQYSEQLQRHEKANNEITKLRRLLNIYWNKIVEEIVLKPQKKGANLRKPWLYNANSYRRMVEPLDIAGYYGSGNRGYIANRPNHYKLFEKWWIEHKKDTTASGQTSVDVGPAEDSCFWAYVEEATVSLQKMEERGSSCTAADIAQEMQVFKANLMHVLTVVRSL